MTRQDETGPGQGASLTGDVLARLRGDILTGAMQPDERMKIETLRKRYEMGASPIREALSQLVSDGLVIRHEQRGFHVAPISLAEFDDLVTCRCRLEDYALRDAIAAGDETWEDNIVLAFHRLRRQGGMRDLSEVVGTPEWERRHKRFHMALLEGCPSQQLRRFCAQLYDQVIRYRALASLLSYPQRDIPAEHEAIMNATLKRDADEATALLMRHYRSTGDYLRQALRRRIEMSRPADGEG